MLRTTHLEDLAIYKAEQAGTTASVEIRKLLHIEAVRKTAKKYGWYLKEQRKGMVDHVLIPTFPVTEAHTLMFFTLVLDWIHFIGHPSTESPTIPIFGRALLTICWMTTVKVWHHKDTWKRVLEPGDIFHNIMERNKHQLLKSIYSPVATGPLSIKVGRDGGG